MSPAPGPAFEVALALFQAPIRLAEARNRPLPEETEDLLRLLGGAPAALEEIAARLQVAPALLHEACIFFVTELLFAPDADSYRVLGLRPDCDPARIKEHHRLLIRWLHPDRDAQGWHSVHAERVNRAWQDLRTPDRQRAYAAARPPPAAGAGAPFKPVLRTDLTAAPERPRWFADRILPRLPALLLGAGASLAALLSLALWYVQSVVPEQQAPRPRDGYAPATAAAGTATSTSARARAAAAPTGVDSTAAAPPVPILPAASPTPALPTTNVVVPAETPPRKSIREQARFYAAPPSVGASLLANRDAASPTVGSSLLANRPSATIPASPAIPAIPAIPASPASPANAPPQASAVSASLMPAALPQPDPIQAAELIEAFTAAYAAGDLPRLLSLFAEDARIERGGLAEIAEDYGKLFQDSRARRLSLPALDWRLDGGAWIGTGRFLARVQPRGFGRPREVRGGIRFRLRDGGHGLRIERIDHQPDS